MEDGSNEHVRNESGCPAALKGCNQEATAFALNFLNRFLE
jgi:hypothetical protein